MFLMTRVNMDGGEEDINSQASEKLLKCIWNNQVFKKNKKLVNLIINLPC